MPIQQNNTTSAARIHDEVHPIAGRQAGGTIALSDDDWDLIRAARAAARQAYAPYSGFAVGAAARTRSGAIHCGCNLENAAYGVGLCAEAGALSAAQADGEGEAIVAVAVIGHLVDPAATQICTVVTPCGRCRQMLVEAAQRANADIRVLCCNHDASFVAVHTAETLLPHGFGPASLGRGVSANLIRSGS